MACWQLHAESTVFCMLCGKLGLQIGFACGAAVKVACSLITRFRSALDPAPPRCSAAAGSSMNWSLWDASGRLNWGLAAFVALAVACAGVWSAMLAQCALYRRCAAAAALSCLFGKKWRKEMAHGAQPVCACLCTVRKAMVVSPASCCRCCCCCQAMLLSAAAVASHLLPLHFPPASAAPTQAA